MKFLKICSLFILLVIGFHSNAQYDSIFATVSGDTVTLWQTATYRNCVSFFRMEIEENEFNITWYQVYINDQWVSCSCFFDLSVIFLVLAPGTYHADVYSYVEGYPENPIYEGSVDFQVGNGYNLIRSEIIGQYQSDCYQNVGLSEGEVSVNAFNLYPNPVRDGEILNIEAFPTGGMATLEIFTITGTLVFNKQYDGNQPIRDRFLKDELFPVAGLYLVRLTISDQVFMKKVIVL
jgi:hypothetical protein